MKSLEANEFSPKISSIATSPLENRAIGQSEIDRLYKIYPEMPRDIDSGDKCPTCDSKGSYIWKDEEIVCNCYDQLSRYKHYLNAGVGSTYQTLDWGDYVHGRTESLDLVQTYINQEKEFVRRGVGIILHGQFGSGKSLLMQLMVKELVQRGRSCFFITFSDMLSMFTAGWYNEDEKHWYQKKVRSSDILVIDDIGKEFSSAKNNLNEAELDSILRGRVREGKPTCITMNMSPEKVKSGYGGAIHSLLKEKSMGAHMNENDFRGQARDRAILEIKQGWRRPIF